MSFCPPEEGVAARVPVSKMRYKYREHTAFVTRLPLDTDEVVLAKAFQRFGFVMGVFIQRNDQGDSMNYAFVEFDSVDAVSRAIREMDGTILKGNNPHVAARTIVVAPVSSRGQMPKGPAAPNQAPNQTSISQRPHHYDAPARRHYEDAPPRRHYEDAPPRRYYEDAPPRRYYEDGPPRRYYEDGPPRHYYEDGPPRHYYEDAPPRHYYEDAPPRRYYEDAPPRHYYEDASRRPLRADHLRADHLRAARGHYHDGFDHAPSRSPFPPQAYPRYYADQPPALRVPPSPPASPPASPPLPSPPASPSQSALVKFGPAPPVVHSPPYVPSATDADTGNGSATALDMLAAMLGGGGGAGGQQQQHCSPEGMSGGLALDDVTEADDVVEEAHAWREHLSRDST